MSAPLDHRSEAERALEHAQRNPVMSSDQWFQSAQIHALLALDGRLADIARALREAGAQHPLGDADANTATRENGKARAAPSEVEP